MEGDVQAPMTNETLPGFIPSKLQWPLTTNSDILPYSTVFKDPSLSQAAKLLLFGLTFQSHPESKLTCSFCPVFVRMLVQLNDTK